MGLPVRDTAWTVVDGLIPNQEAVVVNAGSVKRCAEVEAFRCKTKLQSNRATCRRVIVGQLRDT